jgi:hypothetical protein
LWDVSGNLALSRQAIEISRISLTVWRFIIYCVEKYHLFPFVLIDNLTHGDLGPNAHFNCPMLFDGVTSTESSCHFCNFVCIWSSGLSKTYWNFIGILYRLGFSIQFFVPFCLFPVPNLVLNFQSQILDDFKYLGASKSLGDLHIFLDLYLLLSNRIEFIIMNLLIQFGFNFINH